MPIRLARSDEAELLGAVLADALGEDPIFRWLIPASPRRDRRLLRFFTAMSSAYLDAGKSAYLAEDDAGAALWAGPGTTWRMQFDLRQLRAVLASFGARWVVRGVRTQGQLASLHPRDPHWYLGFLGVRGSQQNRGLGGALLAEVLRKADDERVSAYVESSNRRNLPFYERHGFEIVEEIRLLGNGPDVWRLWRSAPGSQTAGRSTRLPST
jgi:ribosomal protein S18 acetylase RimI-like enzyme